MRLALLPLAQFRQQALDPLAVATAVPRRVQSRPAVERADAEAGVVSERQGAAALCGGSGFEAGVSEERCRRSLPPAAGLAAGVRQRERRPGRPAAPR